MEAIESVRQQTYTHWEIVLVDDASTDNSKQLYKDLETDERIHIYYNEQNMGCGYTKRRCAELAQGEICGFLDADDCLLPKALQVMVDAHKQHPNAALISSRLEFCDEKMNTMAVQRLLNLQVGESYLEHRDYSAECFVSFKKSSYNKTDGIDAHLPLGVDQDLYFRLEEHGNWIVLDSVTYRYRSSNSSISGANNGFSALFWNLIARHNAYVRRGINSRQIIEKDFEDFIEKGYFVKGVLFNQELQIRSSHAYRLGKFLLRPFSWIRNNMSK